MALRYLLLLSALAGCRGAAADYQDFLARRQSDGGVEQVVQSSLQDLNGMWLVHALLAGGLDLGLRVELTMDATAQPISLHARMWLEAADPTIDTPVVDTETIVNADGTFELEAMPLKLVKGSTPGLNVDVTANVVLHASTQSATSWCGSATGNVSDPLSLDLQGSTFAARPATRSLQLADVPQSCFPKGMTTGPVVEVPKPASPDLSSVSSMLADLSGSWIINANLAGSLPLQLWADLVFTPGTPDGGTTAGSLDGSLRRATDPPGSLALGHFSTQVSGDGPVRDLDPIAGRGPDAGGGAARRCHAQHGRVLRRGRRSGAQAHRARSDGHDLRRRALDAGHAGPRHHPQHLSVAVRTSRRSTRR
jgi:hypothetical protein